MDKLASEWLRNVLGIEVNYLPSDESEEHLLLGQCHEERGDIHESRRIRDKNLRRPASHSIRRVGQGRKDPSDARKQKKSIKDYFHICKPLEGPSFTRYSGHSDPYFRSSRPSSASSSTSSTRGIFCASHHFDSEDGQSVRETLSPDRKEMIKASLSAIRTEDPSISRAEATKQRRMYRSPPTKHSSMKVELRPKSASVASSRGQRRSSHAMISTGKHIPVSFELVPLPSGQWESRRDTMSSVEGTDDEESREVISRRNEDRRKKSVDFAVFTKGADRPLVPKQFTMHQVGRGDAEGEVDTDVDEMETMERSASSRKAYRRLSLDERKHLTKHGMTMLDVCPMHSKSVEQNLNMDKSFVITAISPQHVDSRSGKKDEVKTKKLRSRIEGTVLKGIKMHAPAKLHDISSPMVRRNAWKEADDVEIRHIKDKVSHRFPKPGGSELSKSGAKGVDSLDETMLLECITVVSAVEEEEKEKRMKTEAGETKSESMERRCGFPQSSDQETHVGLYGRRERTKKKVTRHGLGRERVAFRVPLPKNY